jgi:hypothetical protein
VLAAALTVVVHNIAGVPDRTLARARTEIAQIFGSGCIKIAWADVGESGFRVQVKVRRRPGDGPGAKTPSALGTTIARDTHGGTAFVFYERVLNFAHDHRWPVETILALAIAHELGHVLLPAPAHTASGLMKAEWDDDDIRRLATGARAFTAEQATLMNAAIDRLD